MPKKEDKLDKDALICDVVERLVTTSTTWAVLLEQAPWREKIFLLQKKKQIDSLISEYKSLTGR